MKTLNISISELEFNKFGFKADSLSFSDLLDIVSKELMRQNLNKSVELAEKYGLSTMTTEEINQKVKAVRSNTQNRH